MNSKEMCRLAFEMLCSNHTDIFGNNMQELYYDLQSILYTINRLPIDDERHFILNQHDCESVREFQRFQAIEIMVKRVNQELTIGDFSDLNADSANQNHSLQQFIELATSQAALFNP